MTHHVSPFMQHTLYLSQSFDEAAQRESPEVTLWFKTESARMSYYLWLHSQFNNNRMMSYDYKVGSFGPDSFHRFQLLGIKYTLEVDPE
ncbi:hypothetical protein HYPP_02615 [Hyphomicrobium sp. ghe19]|nr:hypothetical protein HYPP_02615 [Hyphomicrobium sp. ghe19]